MDDPKGGNLLRQVLLLQIFFQVADHIVIQADTFLCRHRQGAGQADHSYHKSRLTAAMRDFFHLAPFAFHLHQPHSPVPPAATAVQSAAALPAFQTVVQEMLLQQAFLCACCDALLQSASLQTCGGIRLHTFHPQRNSGSLPFQQGRSARQNKMEGRKLRPMQAKRTKERAPRPRPCRPVQRQSHTG